MKNAYKRETIPVIQVMAATTTSVENMPIPKPVTNAESIPAEVAASELRRPVPVDRRPRATPKSAVVNRTAESAKDLFCEARRFFRDIAERYPVQVILGLGATAFVTGAALRIWRSNRYARKQFFYKWRA